MDVTPVTFDRRRICEPLGTKPTEGEHPGHAVKEGTKGTTIAWIN